MNRKTLSTPSREADTGNGVRMTLGEAIIHSAKDAVVVIDEKQDIVYFNPAAEVIFGCPAGDVLGKPLSRFIPERLRNAHRGHVEEYGRHYEKARTMGADRVVMALRADGREFPVDATISRVDNHGQPRFMVLLRDVTERVRMQNELRASLENQKRAEADLRESRDSLRELSAALQSIREEEKTRIARELHDELGQALTALKMEASAIADELEPDQAVLARRATGMKQLIDQTVASVRRISADLRPVMLDNLGLAPTLEWLVRTVAARSGLEIDLFMPDEDLGVSGDAATAIFRIVQEALTNVVRHAGASHVHVEVVRVGGDVRVRVVDDGHGISESDQRKARSFGLLGMRERAYVLGGGFHIKSSNSDGTTVEATIPAFGTVRGRAS